MLGSGGEDETMLVKFWAARVLKIFIRFTRFHNPESLGWRIFKCGLSYFRGHLSFGWWQHEASRSSSSSLRTE
jgi:hypothetical protein